jgi:hypothetical protein
MTNKTSSTTHQFAASQIEVGDEILIRVHSTNPNDFQRRRHYLTVLAVNGDGYKVKVFTDQGEMSFRSSDTVEIVTTGWIAR